MNSTQFPILFFQSGNYALYNTYWICTECVLYVMNMYYMYWMSYIAYIEYSMCNKDTGTIDRRCQNEKEKNQLFNVYG